jgi:hypothetical protein
MAGPPKPKLRWFQYSLRSLLLFVTACAIACSWLAVTIQSQRRQGAAAKAIEKAGGTIVSEPTWLGKLLRDGSLVAVTQVILSGEATTDAVLVHLQGLNQLEKLVLADTRITDAGLANLCGLGRLDFLMLGNTQVTDAGLVHLEGLAKLEELWLENTNVSDVGLKHLTGLKHLRVLNLSGTKVTHEGVEDLLQKLPDCGIGGLM